MLGFMDEDEPKSRSLLGCLVPLAIMSGILWAVIIGVVLLIRSR